jgi:ABC-type bacteriocin/lantibiotic exporter with double-glycine peptidase domain
MHNKNPLHMILSLIMIVLAVFGLWNHDWTLIIVAVVIMIIKKIMFHSCCKDEAKPARRARPRSRAKRRR